MSRQQDFFAATAYVALIVASLSIGFYTGTWSTKNSPEGKKKNNDTAGELAVDPMDEYKLALVVRTDLGMSVGKIAAQCSHATLACYQALSDSNPPMLRQWERSGQSKVALRCSSEDELLLLQAEARSLRLCARSIQDAGRTQIAAGSRTVVGIGPGPAQLVNKVTSKLRLL